VVQNTLWISVEPPHGDCFALHRTLLLLAGNDTVPNSKWRGRGVRSTECLLV